MSVSAVRSVAILLTALALIPAGAHLFELSAKIGLEKEDYLVVQTLYRGWSWFGIVLVGEIIADVALVYLVRSDPGRRLAAIVAAAGAILVLVIFFAWTYPVNGATENWTIAPPGWEALRARWEYSHLAGAIVTFIALCALVWPVRGRTPWPE